MYHGLSFMYRPGHAGMKPLPAFDPFQLLLGIPKHQEGTVGIDLHNPVEHILPGGPGIEHHIALLRGRIERVQIHRVPIVQKRDHAGTCNGHRNIGMSLRQQLADHIQIFPCIHDFRHTIPPIYNILYPMGAKKAIHRLS